MAAINRDAAAGDEAGLLDLLGFGPAPAAAPVPAAVPAPTATPTQATDKTQKLLAMLGISESIGAGSSRSAANANMVSNPVFQTATTGLMTMAPVHRTNPV